MSSFFKRTRLWAQIQEIAEEYARLKRNEHRSALRAQRRFVQLQLMREIQKSRLQRVDSTIAALHSAASIAAANKVKAARTERRDAVKALASAKGASFPTQGGRESPDEYKRRIITSISSKIPEELRGVSAGKIVDAVVADSVAAVELGDHHDPEKRNVDLAAALIKQTGVSRSELDKILERVAEPADEEVNNFLREKLLHLAPKNAAPSATMVDRKG